MDDISKCSVKKGVPQRLETFLSCFLFSPSIVGGIGDFCIGGGSETGNGEKVKLVLPLVCSSYKITNIMKNGEYLLLLSTSSQSSINPRYFRFGQESIGMVVNVH